MWTRLALSCIHCEHLHSDEFYGLWRYVAKALVPHIHRGSERDEVTIAVVARVVPVWVQGGEAVDQVGAEGLVESKAASGPK